MSDNENPEYKWYGPTMVISRHRLTTEDRTHLKNAVPVRTTPKLSRNAPCPCGSGKKNKKCCGVAVMPGSE